MGSRARLAAAAFGQPAKSFKKRNSSRRHRQARKSRTHSTERERDNSGSRKRIKWNYQKHDCNLLAWSCRTSAIPRPAFEEPGLVDILFSSSTRLWLRCRQSTTSMASRAWRCLACRMICCFCWRFWNDGRLSGGEPVDGKGPETEEWAKTSAIRKKKKKFFFQNRNFKIQKFQRKINLDCNISLLTK